jgi:hypothetical protein
MPGSAARPTALANAASQPKSTAFHIEPGGFMNAGTGRAAARNQFAIALTTGITAGR